MPDPVTGSLRQNVEVNGNPWEAIDAEDLRAFLLGKAEAYARRVNYEASEAIEAVLDELYPERAPHRHFG